MFETDEEFIARIAAAAGITPAQFNAIMVELETDIWQIRRLASGDYTLCDGYCQGS